MGADPLVYCLEQLTDYEQFERLCHDLMVSEGYVGLEPLGGTADKGRDAIRRANAPNGQSIVFAYSVREDWDRKLQEDCSKVKKHGHACDVFAFAVTSRISARERDAAVKHVQKTFGWTLELFSLERLRTMLVAAPQLIAQHPQIFAPPFFPRAGGLSVVSARDTVIVDAVGTDFALAGWLARRLSLQGYRVWSAVTAPLAGESESETVNALISTRAAKVVSILSNAASRDPDAVSRRGRAAQDSLLIPATAEPIDWAMLDSKTKVLTPARFEVSMADGLRVVLHQLENAGVPRGPETAVLDHRVFAAADSLLREPEKLHSNQFAVLIAPTKALRFRASDRAAGQDWSFVELQWGCRRDGRSFLSLVEPPQPLVEQLGLRPDGDAQFSEAKIDGVRSRDLLTELLTKTLRAHAVARGLSWCHQKQELHFPQTESVERISFVLPDGKTTHVKGWGERSFWRPGTSTKYRYALAPEFAFTTFGDADLRMTVRVHVRISDERGNLEKDAVAFSRRKRLSASWYNDEWFKRLLAVVQFLAGGAPTIDVLSGSETAVRVSRTPLAYDSPFGVNEAGLKDFAALRQEAIEMQLDDQNSGDNEEDEVTENA